jgi:ABC-2 type transport system ATP-binding protein
MIEVRGLTKSFYNQKVLSNVSFDIAAGEVFGYIGPNGAGKTTTLKILAGLVTKFEGSVKIDGVDVAEDRGHAHALIGYLPQASGFQQWRTVESALDSLGALSGVPDETRAKRIPPLLERLDLWRWRAKKVKELSGGMTQKLALAQALLHEPRLLVLDEPLEGLDPPSRNLLKEIIRERRAAGATVLFSSHILSDVEDVADRIGILNNGALTSTGSIRDLIKLFGLPDEVGVELSRQPSSTDFLTKLGAQLDGDRWRLTVPQGGDTDEIIHQIVEQTLTAGGRIRKVGVIDPKLDDLFARFIKGTHGVGN